MAIESVNPATGETIGTYRAMSARQFGSIVDAAGAAAGRWRTTSFAERGALLRAAAALLRSSRERFARLMAQEMGKPVRDGRSEIEKCAWACEHYADNAGTLLAPEDVPTDATHSFVTFQPLGVVLAIMPWNFPFWQVFRFAAPALAAGNAVLLKHAPNVPACGLAIEEVFRQADFPPGVFQALLIEVDQVGQIIAHPAVSAVTLTGSTRAGRAVASDAGARLKKTVLELGGSDPCVILEDADLDAAVPVCVESRLVNSGQSCIAAKRFIVPRSLREEFERRFVDLMRARIMGDPLDERTQVGPQARADLRENLHRQVAGSVARGARCLLGGQLPQGPGFFYPPTVLTDVAPGMQAYDEEVFGPVAAIIPVRDEQEAIRTANDTSFGLGAAVFTRDPERGERIAARDLQAGCCFVNAMVRSDPRLPFGGIKESGWGRELGAYGIKEFVNIKTVYVK